MGLPGENGDDVLAVEPDVNLLRYIIVPVLIIALFALLIVALVPSAPVLLPWEEVVAEVSLLVVVSIPTLFIFCYRPLKRQCIKHQQEVEKRSQLQSDFLRLAYYDSLTQLPNQRQFEDMVDDELRGLSGGNDAFSVILIKIRKLSEINDVLGYEAGNDTLLELASRFKKAIRAPDTVARGGGNEFFVLVSCQHYAETRDILDQLVASLELPIQVKGTTVNVAFSIGYVSAPFHGRTRERLLRHVDVAVRLAKSNGVPYAAYDRANDPYSMRSLELFSGLKEAVYNNKGLSVFYQPKANFETLKMDSVEALVRWNHRALGGVSPEEFIPIAEKSGLIRQLTYRVMEEVIRQMHAWGGLGMPIKAAVNLSAKDIQDTRLVSIVKVLLQQYQVPPSLLELEITESAFMDKIQDTVRNICLFKEMGVTVTIDDFGTGYSSLSYLSKLPIDTIKIDKSFVTDFELNEYNQVIVKTCIELAHSLGMTTVAEGVEKPSDLQLLRDHHCDFMQGYLIGKPMQADALVSCVQHFDRRVIDLQHSPVKDWHSLV